MTARQPIAQDPQAKSQPLTADIHDRVLDAYYGRLGPQFMRDTQDRIHWICRQVRGESVLDVGCSQGIASILIARENRKVTGIDVSPRAIDEANSVLATEAASVRRYLTFINCDFLSYDPAGQNFDSIVMSEVLEHLVQPERFIERAASLLEPGGTLIVTVPFGINDYIDHKHTFYLLEPWRLISKHFDVSDMVVLGKWLGLKAIRKAKSTEIGSPVSLAEAQIAALEDAFACLERSLSDDLEGTRKRLNDANLKYRDATEQIATLKQRLAHEESEKKRAGRELEQAGEKFAAEAAALRAELAKALQQGAEQSDVARHAEAANQRLSAEFEFLKQRVQTSDSRWREADAQLQALRERMVQAESQRDLSAKELDMLSRQLAAVTQARDEERVSTRQQIASLTEESRAGKEAVHQAEKQVIKVQAERDLVEVRLSELSRRYHEQHEAAERLHLQLQGERSARLDQERASSAATAQHEAAMQAAEERLVDAGSAVARWQQKVEAAEAACQELRGQLTALTDEVLRHERIRQELEASKEALQNRLTHALLTAEAQLTSERAEASRRIAELESALIDRQQTISEQSSIHDQLNGALFAAEKQLGEQRSEAFRRIGGLESALSNQQQAISEQVLQQEQLRSALTHLAAERADAFHRIGDLEAALREQREAVSAHQSASEEMLRAAGGQIEDLEATLARQKQVEAADKAALQETRTGLNRANDKYRKLTAEEIPQLKSKLETQRIAARDAARALEKAKVALQESHREVVSTGRKLQDMERRKTAAEEQVSKTRATLSFQLGYLLIHGFKSARGIMDMPRGLLALRKEAQRRRSVKGKLGSDVGVAPVVKIAQQESHRLVPAAHVANLAPALLAANATPPLPDAAPMPARLRMACIMDEFTYGSYRHECETVQLTPEGWQAAIAEFRPELLFVESAWRGKDGLWGSKVGHTSRELQAIIRWCRDHAVPTVFWNKEDPVHFETFLTTAKLFDFIFTTDIDCIHRYKAALGHERVYLLPFACQPATNNPVETFERRDAVSFAGAYYAKYPERTRDLETFVAELPSFKPIEIFDRNFGKDDPSYQFPPSYQPYIVGTLPFEEIDKAYKGYRYAINLNSIKQSQSMFARRVFELLACNTLTISNFSRGVRLLFGDLVISSDSGSEVLRRLRTIEHDGIYGRKLRLAALRKVLGEHTYGHRLAYILSKVTGKAVSVPLPKIAVVAEAVDQTRALAIISQFESQKYANGSLYLVTDAVQRVSDGSRIEIVSPARVAGLELGAIAGNADLVAGWVACDYYGPNYLSDIALATRYSDAVAIGKAAYYEARGSSITLSNGNLAFHYVDALPARSAAERVTAVKGINALTWIRELPGRTIDGGKLLAIDEFNYCRDAARLDDARQVTVHVDDLPGVNVGLSAEELLSCAESIEPAAGGDMTGVWLSGKQLADGFSKKPSAAIQMSLTGEQWRVDSSLDDGKHEYLYATSELAVDDTGFADQGRFHLDVTPGLNIQLVVLFLDAQKQKISHVIKHANRNESAAIPVGTAFLRFGLRFYAGGNACINGLVLGEKKLEVPEMLGEGSHLVVTNHYPSYEDLYRNGFVHSRVRAYQERGVRCEVFRFRAGEAASYHEFEGIDVLSGTAEVLHRVLSSGRFQSVLVHFLDQNMWEVLRHYVGKVKVAVWVHGAEIQPWYRRAFNFKGEVQLARAKVQSEERMAFWRGLLRDQPENLKLVFVSKHFAETVMEDLGFRLNRAGYEIIHNPIDTERFKYVEKPTQQRSKVLSIRPYASKTYANDLSVAAIEQLSTRPCFDEMEFRLIGDGPLFESTLEPLRRFPNVLIEKRFLTQNEIAELHKDYGIFLVPTRMDTQGVSRDEAMSSGLVPVTNAVAAVPDFVDSDCGILCEAEDAMALAKALEMLHSSPQLFSRLSAKAAARVRGQSNAGTMIAAELKLMGVPGM
ncbi:methyltransferase domain-containing protein [Cupriavidus necator]|uniref:methyltransferase domain-containing protein n=1 Tax=Cupriavidus necator TaxID=106590 RepID=UPI0039C411E0